MYVYMYTYICMVSNLPANIIPTLVYYLLLLSLYYYCYCDYAYERLLCKRCPTRPILLLTLSLLTSLDSNFQVKFLWT